MNAKHKEPERFIVGADLGQSCDYSTAVTVRQTVGMDEATKRRVSIFDVVDLRRWPLKTPYTHVVADLRKMFERPTMSGTVNPLAGGVLVVDRSGVGRGVWDMLLGASINAKSFGLTITGGANAGTGSAPKRDIVAALIRTLSERRLRIAGKLELATVLVRELETFKAGFSRASKADTFGAAAGAHDDLVMAAGLAVWWGERNGVSVATPPSTYAPRGGVACGFDLRGEATTRAVGELIRTAMGGRP